MAPRRFVPCGREYRRDTETFAPGKPELCRDPRYCPHCDRIAQLSDEVRRLLHPIIEVTIPADALNSEDLRDLPPGRIELLRPGAQCRIEDDEVLDIEPNDD